MEIQDALLTAGWQFCFIGGLVVPRWGVERTTRDVDLTALTNFVDDEALVAYLLTRYKTRVANPREFAARARVLLLTDDRGIDLDVALGALGFEARCIDRASWWIASREVRLLTCSAEDLIVHKAFASRDRDWGDVESVLSVQRERLNFRQIFEELAPLAELKEDPSIVPRLERMLWRHGLSGRA